LLSGPCLNRTWIFHASLQQQTGGEISKALGHLPFLPKLALIAIDADSYLTNCKLLQQLGNSAIRESKHRHIDALARLAKIADVQVF
jgi:hypothetical protein